MRLWKRAMAVTVTACAIAALSTGTSLNASNGAKPPQLEYLGEALIPPGTTFQGTVIGGLSSITYDAARDEFYALSDDQGQINPARFYTLHIDVGDGHLDAGDVQFVGVTTLLAPDGQPYPAASLDPEGFTLAKSGEFIVTSEGITNRGIKPWVRRYARDGTYLGDLFVPDAFTVLNPPPASPPHGVRGNLAFESAAVAPDGRHLFVGMEGALYQDGPAATPANGTLARILRYNLSTGNLDRQYVYEADPVAEPSVPPTAFFVNGLVELLPFNTQFMLAMERSFSVGAPGTGNTIKLYWASITGADNVNGLDSIAAWNGRPMTKTLLFDFDELGIPLDNIEGMVLGPRLPDGRQSLIIVSDNNFAPVPAAQFLMFAIE